MPIMEWIGHPSNTEQDQARILNGNGSNGQFVNTLLGKFGSCQPRCLLPQAPQAVFPAPVQATDADIRVTEVPPIIWTETGEAVQASVRAHPAIMPDFQTRQTQDSRPTP